MKIFCPTFSYVHETIKVFLYQKAISQVLINFKKKFSVSLMKINIYEPLKLKSIVLY